MLITLRNKQILWDFWRLYADGTNLAQYPASRNPGNLNLFGMTCGRNATLVQRRQVNRPEPFSQWLIGGVKQRPRRNRGLVMALGTLAGMARADDIAMIAPAGFFRSLSFLPTQQVSGFQCPHDSIFLYY